MPDTSTVLDTPATIAMYALLTQWHALKLEALGMKRRGRSVKAILAERYGLLGRTSITRVQLAHIEAVRVHAAAHNLDLPVWAR